jgi:choline-sulfatase
VLIVTIDTLRADRIGVYGSTVETPHIDRLAREGAWAPQATVHAPLTRPSHVSLFTGLYPAEHGIRDNVSPPLAANVPVLAEIFGRDGFATGAFIASPVLDRHSGLARGFQHYSDHFESNVDRKPGDLVVAEALEWMRPRLAAPEREAGFFAWVHLYDPHAPYLPPEPYATKYAGRPYDGTVAWSDELVGRLVGALRERGALDRTLVIVTSDHGEALGDHGEDVHGYFVYEATLRVPLVIRGPSVTPGTQLDIVARTIDLPRTILELTGRTGAPRTSGRSLADALKGVTMRDEPSFAESLVPLLHYGWSDLRAVRDGRWKFILAPRPELYDLQNDPGELRNLAAEEYAKASAMRSAIEATLRTEQITARSDTARAGIPPEVLERLGALGYIGAGGSSDSKSKGADPKDKLAEYKVLSTSMQDAIVALRARRYTDAVSRLRDVSRRGVDSFEVHYYMGRALAGLERWREAAAEYEKASAKLPGDVETVRGLGQSRVAMGDRAGASRTFEKLVLLAPRDPVARLQLGEAYRDQARYAEAEREIREGVKLDPAPAQYWNSLGTVLGAAGKMAEAERAFAEAVSREPNNGLYVYNRSLALEHLGRRDEAVAQKKRAADLGYPPRAR